MKNLTNLLTILFLAFFCFQANAQTFGVKAGLNLANMLSKDDDDTYSDDFKMNPGFHLGLAADFPITDFLSFEPGLLFMTKGMRFNQDILGFSVKGKLNLYYIDIPLNMKATFKAGDNLKVFATAGPYIGLGLSGKAKSTTVYQGEKETHSEDIKWGGDEDEDDFKRLDFGLTFGAGVEIKAISIGLSYDLGLANISSYKNDGTKISNRVLKLSVGYRF